MSFLKNFLNQKIDNKKFNVLSDGHEFTIKKMTGKQALHCALLEADETVSYVLANCVFEDEKEKETIGEEKADKFIDLDWKSAYNLSAMILKLSSKNS